MLFAAPAPGAAPLTVRPLATTTAASAGPAHRFHPRQNRMPVLPSTLVPATAWPMAYPWWRQAPMRLL